jgi:hypothetical protein
VALKIKVAPGYSPETPLVLTSGGQLVTDRYGMSTARAQWWYHGDSPENQIGLLSAHPRWAFLDLDKRTITRAEDGHWDIVGDYFGVQGTQDPLPIYALDFSTNSEPIETHPQFETFAGRPDVNGDGLNGAKFDEDGSFLTFKQLGTSGEATNRKWVGVRAYLNATAVWRETRVSKTRPTGTEMAQIGRIDTPVGEAPVIPGRNYLFGSMSYDQKGKTFTIRREWLLSGPSGWNDVLYAAAT